MIYMILFWTMFCVSLLCLAARCNGYSSRRLETGCVFFFAACLFLMLILRGQVGVDYGSYNRIYQEIRSIEGGLGHVISAQKFEAGFSVLNYLSPNFRTLIVITAVLAISFKLLSFERENKNRIIILFFYYCSVYFFYDMGILRQGIAIGITFLSIKYIRKSQFFIYTAFILAAMSFHITAVLAFPLYFLKGKEYSRAVYYGAALAAIAVSELSLIPRVFHLAVELLHNDYLSHKVYVYLNERIGAPASPATILKRFLFLIFFIECLKRKNLLLGRGSIEKTEDPGGEIWLYVNGYFLSLLEMLLLSFIPILSTRGTSYLYFLQIFIFAKLLNHRRNRWIDVLLFIFFAALFFNTMRNTIHHTDGGNYLPYRMMDW